MNRRQFITRAALAYGALSLPGRSRAVDVPLRAGIIGHTGRGDFGHAVDRMWQHVEGVDVVAVADAHPEGLAAVQRTLPHARGFASYETMLREMALDVVAVAPRHADQHHRMTLDAVGAGARAIYLEKPFCRTPAEADDILAACDGRQVTLAVAHRNRYHPALPVVADLVRTGTIGDLLEIRARGKEDARGGAEDLWVLGGHLLNIADWLTGPAAACTAGLYQDGRPCTPSDRRDGPEAIGPIAGNQVHARFEMADGLPLFFDSIQHRGTRASGFGLQIVGTRGIIDMRMDEDPIAHLRRGHPHDPRADADWIPVTSAGVGRPEPLPSVGPRLMRHQLAGDDLIDAMRHRRAPLCDARAGATVVEMTCAVFESHRRAGARVTLPLDARDHPWSGDAR